MKYYTIYETINKVNGRCYIGKHITDNLQDNYLGSGKYLKRAINKYGIDNFEKKVLYIFDNKEDMDNKERELVNDEYLKTDKTYNLKLGGQGGFDHIQKLPSYHDSVMRGYHNGYGNTEKQRIWSKVKYKKGIEKFWKSNDPEIIKKQFEVRSRASSGRVLSEEHKKKIGLANSKNTGERNSQYGNCWIHNSEKSISIDKNKLDLYLQEGWVKGRKMKF
jgi:hypothetical protein